MNNNKLEFASLLNEIFKSNKLEVFAQGSDNFHKLSELLVETNKTTNLTAICDTKGIIVKHIADSLIAHDMFKEGATIIDIGCGAGFPTLPLAIARPDLKITALDSTGKKIEFVKTAVKELGLSNVNAVCSRAEEFITTDGVRESFDYATARAVSRLNVLSEICLGFVKMGGHFIAMKAKDGKTELEEAENAIAILGGKTVNTREMLLYGDSEPLQRYIIDIEKEKNTPLKYPRMYNKITKNPL